MSSTRHAAALDRLMASRARLAHRLLPVPGDAHADAAGNASSSGHGTGWAAPRRWRAQWRLWTRRGPLAPVLMAVHHGLGGWWRRHPWRDTAMVAGELGAANLRPLIRRHPFIAIGLGATAGAALAAAQPWRWRALRVHATRGTRQALGWAMRQLGQPAIQMLIAGLLVGHLKSAAETPKATAPTAPL